MSETRDARLVRNAIAILFSLDRHEIEPMTEEQWRAFRDDPCRQFLRAGDTRRKRIWAAIQGRMPADLREAAAPCEVCRQGLSS